MIIYSASFLYYVSGFLSDYILFGFQSFYEGDIWERLCGIIYFRPQDKLRQGKIPQSSLFENIEKQVKRREISALCKLYEGQYRKILIGFVLTT